MKAGNDIDKGLDTVDVCLGIRGKFDKRLWVWFNNFLQVLRYLVLKSEILNIEMRWKVLMIISMTEI